MLWANLIGQNGISVGMGGGITLSTTTTNLNYDASLLNASYISVPFQYKMNDDFSLLAELSFIQKGNTSENEASKVFRKYSYLEIPVTFKYALLSKEYFRISSLFGLYGSKGRHVEIRTDYRDLSRSLVKIPFNNLIGERQYDYGFVLGMQFSAGLAGNELFLDARYHFSHRDILKDDIFLLFHNSLRIGVGMLFKVFG